MKRLIPIIILTLALIAGYNWWSNRSETVALESSRLTGSGAIEAETVAITAELGGRILDLKVGEGDEVEAGQLLVELDKAALLARETQLEAALTTAKVNLELVSAAARPEEVAAAEARLNQAKVSQNGAWLTWNRAQKLVDDPHELETRITQAQAEVTEAEQNRELAEVRLKRIEIQAEAASRNQSNHAALVQYEVAQKELQAAQVGLQMAEVALAGAKQQVAHLVGMRDRPLGLIAQANAAWANYRQAEAAVLAAEANLAAVAAGPTAEDIAVAQAQVSEAEAALAAVKVQLAKQTLTAPRAGLISRKLANPGELAAPGATLLELSDLESVDLIVYIPTTQIGRVKLGQKALVYADAYPGETFEGRVSFIAHEAEFTPRTVQTQEERASLVFAVEISIDNPDHRLKPGMPADAEILPEMVTVSEPTATPQPRPTVTPTPRTTPVQQPDAVTPTALPPTAMPATQEAEILSWALNIRSGPGVNYPVVDHLAKGDTVMVVSVDPQSGWLQIQFGQLTGWISNNPAYVMLK